MKLIPRTQSGFGAITLILVVVLVGAIGAAGYFAFQNQSQSKTTNLTAVPTTPKPTAKAETAKVPGDWATYTSEKGKFTVRYPANWKQPTNQELCAPELLERALYLGPDEEKVLKCATEYFGQMAVFSVDGDKRTNYSLEKTDTSKTSEGVSVKGVAGTRESGVVAADREMGAVKGTTEVIYTFYANGRTYVARYVAGPNENPQEETLKDFDFMVKYGLTFL